VLGWTKVDVYFQPPEGKKKILVNYPDVR